MCKTKATIRGQKGNTPPPPQRKTQHPTTPS